MHKINFALRILAAVFAVMVISNTAMANEKPEIFVPSGHTNSIRSFDLSPDGKYLISGSEDKTLKLWDVSLKKEVRTIILDGEVRSAVFSPDGNYVLTGDRGKNLILWDFRTWKVIRKLKRPSSVDRVQFSPDGRHALSSEVNLVYWDIFNGKKIFEYNPENFMLVENATFSNDGRYIGLGALSTGQHEKSVIGILDVKTGKLIKSFPIVDYRINSIEFSPDGKYLISSISTGYKGGIFYVWDVEKGESIREVSFKKLPPLSIDFSPDGKYLAVGTFGKVLLYDAKTWNEIEVLKGRFPVKFSSNGRLLVYSHLGSQYKRWLYEIKIKDFITGKIEKITPANKIERVNWADFDSYGERIITVGRKFFFWDNNTGELISNFVLKDPSGKIADPDAISDDKKYAVEKYVVNGEEKGLRVWDILTGKIIRHFPRIKDFLVRELRFSKDGRYLIAGSWNEEIIAFNLKDFSTRKFKGKHNDSINALTFSPDGKFVFSGSSSEVIMWDIDSGNIVKRFTYSSLVTGLEISNDGRHLLLGASEHKINNVIRRSEYNVILQDIRSSKKLKRLKGHNNVINTITLSANGKFAASGDWDGVIKLWNLKTGKDDRTLIGHTGTVSSIKFSPDERILISTSDDSTTRLWNTSTGQEIAQFISFTDGEWIIITPEGYFNASPNGAKHLNVRIGNNVYSIDNFYEKFFNPVYVASVLQGKKIKAVADIRKGFAMPPDVKIISPEPNATFSTDTISITVSAKDTGGGIDEIRLYHNGKAIGEDQRAVKIIPKGNEVTKAYTVTLVDGLNTFRAVGFSRDRTESNPYELIVKLTAPSKDVSMYILAVGINKYKNPALNLNYAEPDARGIVDFFKQKGRGLFKNVALIEIYNEQATKQGITSKLKQLQNTQPQDAVLIYLAGHGESLGDKWYFIPHEITYPEREEDVKTKGISSEELSGYIKDIKAQKILMLIDACKSGAVMIAFRGFEDRKALSQLSRSTGVHIIAASTKDQFAAEVKELGHGVFTYTLLEGLKGKASSSGETVTVRKLMGYVEEQLPDITKKYKQEAQYPVVDSRGMDFPLVIVK